MYNFTVTIKTLIGKVFLTQAGWHWSVDWMMKMLIQTCKPFTPIHKIHTQTHKILNQVFFWSRKRHRYKRIRLCTHSAMCQDKVIHPHLSEQNIVNNRTYIQFTYSCQNVYTYIYKNIYIHICKYTLPFKYSSTCTHTHK